MGHFLFLIFPLLLMMEREKNKGLRYGSGWVLRKPFEG